ncbi:MAG: GDP-mannose 4,6-dehydratase [Chitinivibrionales bacterium]|nr:GDP-mannose 4,6-dehydratase [Chitinivibrionales bacterium]
MTIALISGINGFVGRHLAAELMAHGRTVAGFDRASQCAVAGTTCQSLDMQDSAALARFVAQAAPDEIYHCAGSSSPPQVDASPRDALAVNILGSVNLLEAMRAQAPKSKLLLVGSMKEYGDASCGLISEEQALNPIGFYGVFKCAVELIGKQYARQYDLDIRFARSFNHTGPGQSPQFVCSDWCRQIALIVAGKLPPRISVGALDAAIDFADVRDVACAYRQIMEKGRAGEAYNVCSGKTVALQEILQYLIKKSNLSIEVFADAGKLRKTKTPAQLAGDYAKIKRDTGWSPTIDIFKTLDDLYDYWHDLTRGA